MIFIFSKERSRKNKFTTKKKMVFWIIRINEYETFCSSNQKRFWLYNSKYLWNCKKFNSTVKKGDIIWFVQGKTNGRILGVATFQKLETVTKSLKSKITLPDSMKDVDTLINYNKFYHLEDLELEVRARFSRDFFQVDKDKHQEVHQMLGRELALIRRYATLKRQMP